MNSTVTLLPKRLLLVDDQADVRDVLRAHLEPEGYEIFEAADGSEAIPLARELQPDLIIVDIYMPTLNGISLCQRLRQFPELAETPILLVTGFASEEILQQALAAGASDYLTKPISWPLLHHRLRQLLLLTEAKAACAKSEQRWEHLAKDFPGLIYRTTADPKRTFR
nr:response regulator [Ardenticatenales bacterium]